MSDMAAVEALGREYAALVADQVWPAEVAGRRLVDAVMPHLVAELSDPNAVHINMLRGTIAKPSMVQIEHIYQGEFRALLTDRDARISQMATDALAADGQLHDALARIKALEAALSRALRATREFPDVEKPPIDVSEIVAALERTP